MKPTGDYRVRDLAEMTLTLRQDLMITPRHDGDEPGYLVEDKVNSKYFRIGVPEYTFLALLDGKTTVREAIGIAARVDSQHAVTEEQAATVCRWLVENQLAFTSESASTSGLTAGRSQAEQKPDQARWNPLFLRISLLRPEGLLRRLLPWTGWLFSWPAALAATLLAAVAGNQVLTHWSHFVTSSRGILSTERWLWIAVAWFVVKLLHELAHGIVCKRYGGSVRDAGVVLILGAPVAYMDVTSVLAVSLEMAEDSHGGGRNLYRTADRGGGRNRLESCSNGSRERPLLSSDDSDQRHHRVVQRQSADAFRRLLHFLRLAGTSQSLR